MLQHIKAKYDINVKNITSHELVNSGSIQNTTLITNSLHYSAFLR
ncbi:hypothetical protein [Mucilaginibacter paludis]|uniref:Uncharacterized protein n=1 Tax=Mucilaginibacter paludis DSM 18603 TaxID=714943 RepID=H1YAS5_9SPHI|nr:hypothetical protein [Mucilaginibacter paludis]EHQ29534.1 hypothetical protein Mucpa_5462 [Mucilaginibacter paludis DSM 18603]